MTSLRPPEILIVGAGIFGVTAARALRARGHDVAICNPGSLPHPLAASTDISKVVRMEYGADELYMEMVEESLPGWRLWNHEFERTLYHETGVLMIARSPMKAGGFEYESFHALNRRRHFAERLDADGIARRFPAWRPGAFVDGFFHQEGGYAESGKVVAALLEGVRQAGVRLLSGRAVREIVVERAAGGTGPPRATGVRLDGPEGDERLEAGFVLVAAGAWTPQLVPDLAPFMKSTGHPVFHLRPAHPALFRPPAFVTFTADVARTGWYGFPLHPEEGVVKIANHGSGRDIHPDAPREVTPEEETSLRTMLEDSLPALEDAPVVFTRRCLYCDTLDEHFWIDRHPEIDRLAVASGGSGHAFKVAPVLGNLVADVLEGHPHPWRERFRWRRLEADGAGQEAARFHPRR